MGRFFSMSKKGQAWGVDLMVGVIIFTVAIIVFIIYSLNYSPVNKEIFEKIHNQAEVVSQNIMSEGYPKDWNRTTVTKLGILTNNKIDQNKIDLFYNISIEDYNLTKRLLNTKYDYYIKFETDLTADGSIIEGIGKNIDFSNIEKDNLIKITRTGVYQNKPISIYIFVWG
jgi:hypothetical protein